jgi:hypothetical protein
MLISKMGVGVHRFSKFLWEINEQKMFKDHSNKPSSK